MGAIMTSEPVNTPTLPSCTHPLETKATTYAPFLLHKDFARPAVFLAGGIGITPVRSILDWATQERLPHKLYLFYSNREAVDAAFIEEFESMTAQNPNFTLIPTVTGHKSLA